MSGGGEPFTPLLFLIDIHQDGENPDRKILISKNDKKNAFLMSF